VTGNCQSDADPLSYRLKALADSVAAVLDLDPVAAARLAPRLVDEAKSVLAAVCKGATVDAATRMRHADIAARLDGPVGAQLLGPGFSVSAVNDAIVEHRASRSARGGESMGVEEGFVGG